MTRATEIWKMRNKREMNVKDFMMETDALEVC